ncbi:MAG: hypothetical protein IJL78_09595 [Lachnospiraceae bacterium]|nr:hypothetical protein [Lachnospiraceae bacterium]
MDVQRAREQLFQKDETFGFIEREEALHAFLSADVPAGQAERAVSALEFILSRLSCPAEPEGIVGRMVEGPVPYEMEPVAGNGFSHVGNPFQPRTRCAGHLTLDLKDLLSKGLSGIVREMEAHAESDAQKQYAAYCRRAVEAVKSFCLRYADSAERAGNTHAAEALRTVPYGPAYDFFSAVQSIWMIEWVLSCVTGGRDFAYGRLDLVLLPYYRKEEDPANYEVLLSFLLKNNEIGGMNSDLLNMQPVPCTGTNIYAMLGGKGAEEALPLSLLILRAAEEVHLMQPVLALRIAKDSPKEWKLAAARVTQNLSGQVSFYNDDAIIPNLLDLGFTEEHALNYTMSGCNRADFPGHMSSDMYDNAPACLLRAFMDPEVTDMDGILRRFREEMEKEAGRKMGCVYTDPETDPRFFFESLFLRGCPERVRDIENGGQDQWTLVHHLCGLATAGNSLAAIEKAVFEDHVLTLPEFRELVKNNFETDPKLHLFIRNRYPKFGNDDPFADHWTRVACEIMVDAVRSLNGTDGSGHIHIPGLYSLWFHHRFGEALGATPDGRLAGEPISENQSPVYGTDREGIAALLHSLGSLPMEKTGCGGLNVRLQSRLPEEMLSAMVDTYFEMGGVNIAVDVVSRETLIDALEHPERHQTLCVRIVGYSEIFVRLPRYMQQELIDRTPLTA